MAKVVDDSAFSSSGSKFAKYLDGQTWELICGDDYENELAAKTCIYSAARYRCLKVTIKKNGAGTGILVKATPKQ